MGSIDPEGFGGGGQVLGSFTESLGLPGGCLVWEGEEQLSQYPAEAGLSFTECWAHIPHNLVVMGHCEGTGAQSKDLCGVGGASASVSTSPRACQPLPPCAATPLLHASLSPTLFMEQNILTSPDPPTLFLLGSHPDPCNIQKCHYCFTFWFRLCL